MPPPTTTTDSGQLADWPGLIHELAAMERPSASDGELRAAQSIADRLRALGCRVAIEEEQAHGSYWWPVGLVNGLVAAAGALTMRGRPRQQQRIVRALTTALA